jgi:hypothetical protein
MKLRLVTFPLICVMLASIVFISAESVYAQKTSKIVARFVYFGASASKPVGYANVTVRIRDWVYEKKTNNKGWLVLSVPCNTEGQITFGDNGEFSSDISVPCSKKPVGIGVFNWGDGEWVSDDMNNIDGCYLCD